MIRLLFLFCPYGVLLVGAWVISQWGRSDGIIVSLLVALAITGVLHTYQLILDHHNNHHRRSST